jgi:flagellin
MRSDNAALSTVQDALGLGAATVDVGYTGLQKAIEVVDDIKSKLTAARQPGVDRGKIQSEISELQKQLLGIAESASFSGENWLSVNSTTAYNPVKTIVSSFSRTSTGIDIGTIDINIDAIKLFDANVAVGADGILDGLRDGATGAISGTGTFSIVALNISALTNSTADLTTLEGYILGTDKALREMTDAATALGSIKARVGIQQDFVKSLMDAVTRGIGQLVDADMNEESTKLQALQVKQQLGVQSLSIANSSSQSILRLFQQ